MKLFFLLWLLLLLLLLLEVNSEDSCTSNLNLKNKPLFDTSSFHCVSVWDEQGYILRVSRGRMFDTFTPIYIYIYTNFIYFNMIAVFADGYKSMEFPLISTK